MTITLRSAKGSALTHNELDGNFTDLDSRVTTVEQSVSASSGSANITSTYDEIQIQTTSPSADSLNELWFNPTDATWSKTIQNPVTGSVIDTQVASIEDTKMVFPTSTSGNIAFGYGLFSSNGAQVVFTTPLWLVSYNHAYFDRVEIHSYILEDDTEVMLYPNAVNTYSNVGTPWAEQRVKSIKFTSGYRANNTTGTLTAAGAPIWETIPGPYISLATLKSEVAASADFADFQSRIALL